LGRRGGGYGDMRVKRREEKYEKAQDEKMGVAKLKNNPPKKKKKKNHFVLSNASKPTMPLRTKPKPN
jgi:hypothetical protein